MISAGHCRRRMRGRVLGGWGWGAGGGGGGGEGSRSAEARYGAPGRGSAVLGGRVSERASRPGAFMAFSSSPCRGRDGPLGGGAAASRSRDSPRSRRGILQGPRDCSLSPQPPPLSRGLPLTCLTPCRLLPSPSLGEGLVGAVSKLQPPPLYWTPASPGIPSHTCPCWQTWVQN